MTPRASTLRSIGGIAALLVSGLGLCVLLGWYADIERLRILTANMINATKEEIAFVKNTSEGISIVANGIDWQWGHRTWRSTCSCRG